MPPVGRLEACRAARQTIDIGPVLQFLRRTRGPFTQAPELNSQHDGRQVQSNGACARLGKRRT